MLIWVYAVIIIASLFSRTAVAYKNNFILLHTVVNNNVCNQLYSMKKYILRVIWELEFEYIFRNLII